MKRFAVTLVFVLSALGGAVVAPPALASPDPDAIWIQSISYGGSGCPQGSVGQSIANDRVRFTMIFDSFVASSGPGVPVTENRKNCQLNLNLHLPAKAKDLVIDLEVRGYVQLPAGGSAEVSSVAYFAGEPAGDSVMTFAGPTARDYVFLASVAVKKVNKPTACGETVPVNVNTAVGILAAPGAQAQITADSIDGTVMASEKKPKLDC